MHSTSQTISSIIHGDPSYSLEQLREDLFTDEKLLRRQEVARIFSVNVKTVDRWVKAYPHVSIKLGDDTVKSTPRRIYIDRLRKSLGM